MEQEYEIPNPSPLNVRRQLLFMTPFKKRSQMSNEIENSPKGKVSKSKIIPRRTFGTNHKVVFDFAGENNYFFNQRSSFDMFNVEEEPPMSEDYHTEMFESTQSPGGWYYTSPPETSRRPQIHSGNLNDYVSVTKESRHSDLLGESPFCKLLNESDKISTKSYQTLTGINELDEEDEALREKYYEQINILECFFNDFRERRVSIMNLFAKDSLFEIIGEEKIHPLDTTLNALAKAFLRFEYESNQLEFEYKFGYSSDDSEIILTTSGKLVGENMMSNFVMSTKMLVQEGWINHVKLQIS